MTHLYWVALKSIWAKEINRFMRIWVQPLVPPVNRRHQGLHPDTHKAVDLFRPDTFQRDPVKMRHALSPCLSCTRETNSSSSRFALLRILKT